MVGDGLVLDLSLTLDTWASDCVSKSVDIDAAGVGFLSIVPS